MVPPGHKFFWDNSTAKPARNEKKPDDGFQQELRQAGFLRKSADFAFWG
jgi:hypothetical protein